MPDGFVEGAIEGIGSQEGDFEGRGSEEGSQEVGELGSYKGVGRKPREEGDAGGLMIGE